jgi:hypothetical protein
MKRRTMFAIFLGAFAGIIALWPASTRGDVGLIVAAVALSIAGIAAVVHDARLALPAPREPVRLR